MRLRETLLADLATNWAHKGSNRLPTTSLDIVRSLVDVRFLPVVLVRLTLLPGGSRSVCAMAASRLASLVNRFVFGVECASQTSIGPGLYFPHTGGIVIGAASIGARCVIYHQVTLGAKIIDMPFTVDLRPSIGNDVTIAAGAKVLGGITVHDRSVVAANAVVTSDVAAGTVVGGVPASTIKVID